MFDNALRIDPRISRWTLRRAEAKLCLGQLEEALQDANVVANNFPQHANAFKVRGLLHYLLGNEPDSEADRVKAVQLDPSLTGLSFLNLAKQLP